MANSRFVDPADFTGDIPGRGRKPSPLALEISKALKGCPVGKATLLTIPATKATSAKERAQVRGAIVTGAALAGWGKAGVQWTTTNAPFVTRKA
jgi:hypothetical protein